MRRAKLVTLIVVAAAATLTVILYLSRERMTLTPVTGTAAPAANAARDGNTTGNPFLDVMSDSLAAAAPAEQPRSWVDEFFGILFRLFLAVVLSGVLAFRPRKDVNLFKRSLFVSQTQILLAVVAAALMMIVGDNAARAFAIFAEIGRASCRERLWF